MKTWKIAYTIQHGEYEYGDYLLHEAEQLTQADAAAVMAAFWCGDCGPEEARFLRELTEDGCAALPSCGRCIADLYWEEVTPIVVTVHNGIVGDVTGLPKGTTLEVRYLDDDDLDDQGEPVPLISVWEGPR